ncbi:MAG TPA: hypothetical protein VN806_13110 [Caulobacteraceae bacterium]|nr:hypothetical protein [Caulobacteraceae bacterium]
MIWLAQTVVAHAVRVVDHQHGVAPDVTPFPFDAIGVASLAGAALFGAIALWAGIVLW